MLGVYTLNYKFAYSNAILHEDHSMPFCAFGVCGVGFLCSFRATGRNSTAVKNQCACERECEKGAPPPILFPFSSHPGRQAFLHFPEFFLAYRRSSYFQRKIMPSFYFHHMLHWIMPIIQRIVYLHFF